MLQLHSLNASLFDVAVECMVDTSHEDDTENPFESAQLVICTLSFLSEQTERLEQAVAAEWDLLVVDEAHHLQWSDSGAGEDYLFVERLAKISAGLLLLVGLMGVGTNGRFLSAVNAVEFFSYDGTAPVVPTAA